MQLKAGRAHVLIRAPEQSRSSSLLVTRIWPMLMKGTCRVFLMRVWPSEVSPESAALPGNCRHTSRSSVAL